jgi:phosphoglycolate phosphatase
VRGVGPDGVVKPDPAGALAIARQLGIAPAEFLYVGDTNTDMQTAVAAGMFAVGALWGFRPAPELLANGARTLIERPEDLLALL